MKRHTSQWKEDQLVEMKKIAEGHPVIAVAALKGFPANLFAQVRKKLHGKAIVKVSKVRVIKRALEQSKIGKYNLQDKANDSIALIATSMNPFELYAYLKKNKGSMGAKTGQISDQDITIPAMDTGLPPGPALSELKAAGLTAKIQGATIAIMEDKMVVKKGDAVPKAVADVLTKLNIKPFKVGLNLLAVYENGEIFAPEVLDIDEDKTIADLVKAHQWAVNLSVEAGIYNDVSTKIMIQKAFRNMKAVSVEAAFMTEQTTGDILAKGERIANVIKEQVKE